MPSRMTRHRKPKMKTRRANDEVSPPNNDETTCSFDDMTLGMLRPEKTVFFLFFIVFIGSIVYELNVAPDSIFSNPQNLFNQVFVKWGWGWTLCFLTPYMVLSGLLTCDKQWYLVLKDGLRLAIATFFWYITVNLFLAIEQATGACDAEGFATKKSCVHAESNWKGFDISGHTFILMHSMLTILEELRSMNAICKYKYSTDRNKKWLSKILPPLIYIFAILLLLLCCLWVWMLLCTAVYFHTFLEKIIAAVIAIVIWLLTYQFWYKKTFSPGSPVRTVE
ncbi:acyl-coenzyme A diphosphatase FITM2-like [Antedon mediterranea]|uniref:acyl-coenzyme A diphosphatase FITM2-like n=1 Tax=Antedon mediterranea TaxID=105859 RepID=UPI003AF7D0F6